jgi:hypothetical protein
MYNRRLSFKLNHISLPSQLNARMPSMALADVLLESEYGIFFNCLIMVSLTQVQHVFERAQLCFERERELYFERGRCVLSPRSYHIFLHENGSWIDSRSRGQPSKQDFLGVLANLRSIKIRGSFYSTAKTVRLASVQVQEANSMGERFIHVAQVL